MKTIIAFLCLLCANAVYAQYTSTWAFTSDKTRVITGADAASVNAGTMVPGSVFGTASHNTDGYQCAIPSGNWPDVATDGLHIDFPFSPVGAVDVNLAGITLTTRTSGSSGNNLISLAYQVNGTGPFIPFGTVQTAPSGGTNNLNFGTVNRKFYSGKTYIIRMYVYAAGTSTSSSRSVRIKNVVFTGTVISPAGTQPTVTTNSATLVPPGRYTANATGTVTAGTLAVSQSGVVWSTAPNPTAALATKTTNGPTGSGSINSAISGLTAGTLYYVRAYAISESQDTIYGSQLQFTTNPPVAPIVTTAAITNILSHRATSGGDVTDSGGVAVTARGIVWKNGNNPTLPGDPSAAAGSGSGSYAALLNNLLPSTNYCVRAYATNAVGTSYGNEVCFNTNAATPILVTSVLSINMGNVVVNTNAPTQSYTLTGSYLSPASGTITINAPAGFTISLSPGSGFASTLSIPYTGGSLPTTTIYVNFSPTLFGSYSGNITHSGGGATGVNIDNVTINGMGIQSPGDVSNMGTDFWVGYGFQALMAGSNGQDMVLYLSSKQDAVVTVEIPGTGYSVTYNVLANVALATNPIPKTGLQDARLNSTGILNRAIHVYSNGIPIAVWAHIYANSSSGATMVLPTNSWGSDYSALTTGGLTNNNFPHSFFFVMASEDNTIVDITPSADITATAGGTTIQYPAGVTFTITLNKGQVFNALGKLTSSTFGVDLTGSKVKARDCKKIALFTGNGRVLLTIGGCSLGNGGSDNFIQQMFPKVAWGSKYLTVPFRDMEAGFFRVVVSDPATVVRVNGTPISGLVNNFYYQVDTDTTNLIESDKPVMVAQYCATNTCSGTGLPQHPVTGTLGDPEMVILSPVQQAINDVTVYSASQYNIQHNYINVVVKNAGVANFQLDGVNVSSLFQVHQKDPAYSYAVFTDLSVGAHRLTSAEPFNAIAYGFSTNSSNESYGYNAGTYLKDLSTQMIIRNPYATTNTATTCKNNPFRFRVAIPISAANINSLTWSFNSNPNILPNTPVVQTAPLTSDSTFSIDGNTFYVYTLPGNYIFNAAGTYPVKVSANATTPDGCVGVKDYSFDIIVKENILADFSGNLSICQGATATFNDISNGNGTTVNGWIWDMGDGSPAQLTSTATRQYNTAGTYNVTLRAINSLGCYDDSTKTLNVVAPPTASFTVGNPRCVNVPVTFTNTSSGGTITKWTWNFNNPASPGTVVANTGAAQTTTYTTPNSYTATLQVENALGCQSAVASQTFTVFRTTADFTINATPTCTATNISFTDASSGGGSAITSWQWNFGAAGTSTLQSPAPIQFAAAGTYNISLTATSAAGCSASVPKSVVVQAPLSAPVINCMDSTFNSVTFGWTAVAGATGYQVSTNGGASFTNPSTGATGTTHVVTGLAPSTPVTIIVRAQGGLSCQQSTATVTCRSSLPQLDVFVPNTFTPNGDGRNDVLKVYNNYLKSVNMKIFNQWGELIFSTNDMTKGWDGFSKGKMQPVGVYIYVVQVVLQDGTVVNKKGSVNLIR